MSKNLYTLTIGLILMMFGTSGMAQIPMYPETVSMGPGYANEIYYRFSDGNNTSSARNTWDISFRSMIMSSSILINDGSGVTLWTYPYADTSGWATVDTFGLYSWTPMYNDPNDWENGAFSRFATGVDTDYGWGVYNMVTHHVVGDSLFVIQLMDGTFKKLWIIEKNSPVNKYQFRYANLDGSDPQEILLDCSLYTEKEFVGFNLQTNLAVDYQPAKTSWDILFTKYMSVQPNGSPYPVTGVLSNPYIYAKKFYPVNPEFNDWESAPWDSTRSAIGWDWKTFDMNAMIYVINDSMVFYVKDQEGANWRLKFTAFAGSSTGTIDFGKARVFPAAIDDGNRSSVHITLYPNPATDFIHIDVDEVKPNPETISLSLIDMTGRSMRTEILPAGRKHITWTIHSLSPGAYLLKVTSGTNVSLNTFLKH